MVGMHNKIVEKGKDNAVTATATERRGTEEHSLELRANRRRRDLGWGDSMQYSGRRSGAIQGARLLGQLPLRRIFAGGSNIGIFTPCPLNYYAETRVCRQVTTLSVPLPRLSWWHG